MLDHRMIYQTSGYMDYESTRNQGSAVTETAKENKAKTVLGSRGSGRTNKCFSILRPWLNRALEFFRSPVGIEFSLSEDLRPE